MKPEEAISAIKNNMPTKGTYTILTEGLELAVQALEKQIPKKPNIKELPDAFGRLYWNVCGACDEEIESDYTYCPDCGQKINWEETP